MLNGITRMGQYNSSHVDNRAQQWQLPTFLAAFVSGSKRFWRFLIKSSSTNSWLNHNITQKKGVKSLRSGINHVTQITAHHNLIWDFCAWLFYQYIIFSKHYYHCAVMRASSLNNCLYNNDHLTVHYQHLGSVWFFLLILFIKDTLINCSNLFKVHS